MNVTSKHPTTLVETYFERAVDANLESYFELFADDVVVEDEDREHLGLAAVRRWRAEVPPVTYTIRETSVDADTAVAVTRIEGDFPGSPVDLRFCFRFDHEGMIVELRIRG